MATGRGFELAQLRDALGRVLVERWMVDAPGKPGERRRERLALICLWLAVGVDLAMAAVVWTHGLVPLALILLALAPVYAILPATRSLDGAEGAWSASRWSRRCSPAPPGSRWPAAARSPPRPSSSP